MNIAKVQVNGTQCTVLQVEEITKGLVGATVSIEYTDSVWNELRKTVVFRGCVTRSVLNAGSEVTVPDVVVSRDGRRLYMGVCGVDAENNVVIPTIWAELGMIYDSATPSSDKTTDSSLPVWAQIQNTIGDLDKLDTTDKSSLVAAVNEALVSGGGETETVQPDWSQNDETAKDYVKNRPGGYSTFEDGTPVARTVTCTTAITGGFKSATSSNNLWYYNTALSTDIYKRGRVTYDGVEYTVELDGKYKCIGDESLEKYPFALGVSEYLGGGTYEYCDYTKTSGDHEITVIPIVETIVKIPAEYLTPAVPSRLPNNQNQQVTGYYAISSDTKQIFKVIDSSTAPTLTATTDYWEFNGPPLVFCYAPTFETELGSEEFFTGIAFRNNGIGGSYGLVITGTDTSSPTIAVRKITAF